MRFGRPCLIGTRIDVATIVGALAADESYEEVAKAYEVTREQILAALRRYAAHVASHLPPAVESLVKLLLDENFPLNFSDRPLNLEMTPPWRV